MSNNKKSTLELIVTREGVELISRPRLCYYYFVIFKRYVFCISAIPKKIIFKTFFIPIKINYCSKYIVGVDRNIIDNPTVDTIVIKKTNLY